MSGTWLSYHQAYSSPHCHQTELQEICPQNPPVALTVYGTKWSPSTSQALTKSLASQSPPPSTFPTPFYEKADRAAGNTLKGPPFLPACACLCGLLVTDTLPHWRRHTQGPSAPASSAPASRRLPDQPCFSFKSQHRCPFLRIAFCDPRSTQGLGLCITYCHSIYYFSLTAFIAIIIK